MTDKLKWFQNKMYSNGNKKYISDGNKMKFKIL